SAESEARVLLNELYENQNEGLGDFENPFQAWAEGIFDNSKSLVQEGSTINPLFIPDLVPILIKIMKLLPLWSGVMVPIFGKLKTVTFKHVALPTELEHFLEIHITSLKDAALIRIPINYDDVNSSSPFNFTEKVQCPDEARDINVNNIDNNGLLSSLQFIEDDPESPSALYVMTGADNYISSNHLQKNEKYKNLRIIDQENKERESWNRKTNKERKSNSYLIPNPHLRHLNISNLKSKQSLPILKNGSLLQFFEELKSTKNKILNEKIILSNTCVFDSLASLMMVSYCDSQLYANKIDDIKKNSFFNFIIKIVKNGITASTYSERVHIIIDQMDPQLQPIEYDTTLAVCDATITTVINSLLKDFPTLELSTICSSICSPIFPTSKVYLSYQTTDGSIKNLQEFLDHSITPQKSKC
ncbi:NOF-FB transposable element protein, partial [Aphis craccivora]